MGVRRTTPKTRGAELLMAAIDNDLGGMQQTAAGELEVHEASLSHFISGRRCPYLKMAVFFERAIGIPCLAWLEPPTATAA